MSAHAGVAQLVEQLICNQQVGGSSPSTSSNRIYGGVPEWPKGADCKSVVDDFDGSNPSSSTIAQPMAGRFFRPVQLLLGDFLSSPAIDWASLSSRPAKGRAVFARPHRAVRPPPMTSCPCQVREIRTCVLLSGPHLTTAPAPASTLRGRDLPSMVPQIGTAGVEGASDRAPRSFPLQSISVDVIMKAILRMMPISR